MRILCLDLDPLQLVSIAAVLGNHETLILNRHTHPNQTSIASNWSADILICPGTIGTHLLLRPCDVDPGPSRAAGFEQALLKLSPHLKEIIHLLSRGLTNKEIASQLHVSARTTKSRIAELFLIFDVSNRTELIGLLAGLENFGICIMGTRTPPRPIPHIPTQSLEPSNDKPIY
jgi:DNA-binding CsgD family transcriptional regulator